MRSSRRPCSLLCQRGDATRRSPKHCMVGPGCDKSLAREPRGWSWSSSVYGQGSSGYTCRLGCRIRSPGDSPQTANTPLPRPTGPCSLAPLLLLGPSFYGRLRHLHASSFSSGLSCMSAAGPCTDAGAMACRIATPALSATKRWSRWII